MWRKLVVLALLAGCAQPHAPVPSARPSPVGSPTVEPIRVSAAGGEGKQPTITGMHGKRKAYYLTAPSYTGARDAAGHSTGVFTQPHVEFYDASGRTMTSDAPKATVDESSKTLVMTGGVRTRTQAGALMTCDRLRYTSADEHFHGEGHVVVTSPGGDRITGDVIDGNVRLENARIRTLPR